MNTGAQCVPVLNMKSVFNFKVKIFVIIAAERHTVQGTLKSLYNFPDCENLFGVE